MDFNRFSIVWYKWQGKRTEVRAMTLVATILYSRGHCFLTPPDNQHNGKANPNPHCTTTSKCRHSFFFLFPSLSFVFLFYFLFLSFFLIFFLRGLSWDLKTFLVHPHFSLLGAAGGMKRFQKQRKTADGSNCLSESFISVCVSLTLCHCAWIRRLIRGVQWSRSEGRVGRRVRETIEKIIFVSSCPLNAN